MKVTTLALTVASAGLALAQPHRHSHQHLHEHKRDVTVTQNAPGPTAYAYVVNGVEISEQQACEGVKNNELRWAQGNAPHGICDSSATSSTTAYTSSTIAYTSSTAATTTTTAFTTTTTTTTTAIITTTTTAAASSAPAQFYDKPSSSSEAEVSSATGSKKGSGGQGLTADFPDGKISCDTFPSDYGAVPVSYLGMGGWSGLQAVTIENSLVNHIVSGISGDNCREGMMCSYACPPGYQKSQWPSTQGATGQSVGGLSCSGGFLKLTNSALSSKLCIPGVGGVQAQNNADSVVSICRTDYPGTESETIPTVLEAGQTQELTVPDAQSYYNWQGKTTSAQYYLNPPGFGASDACQWGNPGKPLGNYAPINLGVGYENGKIWLSIFQNKPTTNAQYPGKVELKGNLSGVCKYENGQYCGVTGCNADGCTVAVLSGTATYVVST